ncbi:uncharacterized protein LOC116260624 [Nymphaea colorata]|uniref:uncharacterized protein LOC116260624 n=1 Tax=Nymphaea colorata TaxID=210225 RepID=UPI00129E7595|nr:uncharacterized protein LOC116260624 [Nymphaea colorata]
MTESSSKESSTTTREWDSDNEEALSLCDLPLVRPQADASATTLIATKEQPKQLQPTSSDDDFEFEFASWVSLLLPDSGDMCAADDVIAGGQLLPFRPSVSSEKGLLDSAERSCRPSRSDSLEHSLCFTSSSRGSSSSRSSGFFDSAPEKRRWSTDSAGLFTAASPRPGRRESSPAVVAGKKKVTTTKMGLFRLGLMRTPEIQLGDLKQRLRRREELGRSRRESQTSTSSSSSSSWKIFRGLDCRCSAIDTVSSAVTRRNTVTKQAGEGRDETEEEMLRIRLLQEKNVTSRLRTVEWLNELPFALRA